MEFDVTIEIPKGHRNKYEVDHETGRIRLDRLLFTSTRYPADYGYVEDSLGEDGDPLDALVLLRGADLPRLPRPRPPDRHVPHARRGRRRRQDPVRACRRPAPGAHHRAGPVSEFDRLEIQHFFETYKDLEPGKSVEGAHWAGRDEAEQCVAEALQRAKDAGMTTARWTLANHDEEAKPPVAHRRRRRSEASTRASAELATEGPLHDV